MKKSIWSILTFQPLGSPMWPDFCHWWLCKSSDLTPSCPLRYDREMILFFKLVTGQEWMLNTKLCICFPFLWMQPFKMVFLQQFTITSTSFMNNIFVKTVVCIVRKLHITNRFWRGEQSAYNFCKRKIGETTECKTLLGHLFYMFQNLWKTQA